jgi:hypothetical protein
LFAKNVRANARDQREVIRSAIARACGRLALGWEEFARHLDTELTAALDEFWEELQLARDATPSHVTTDTIPAAPGTNVPSPPPAPAVSSSSDDTSVGDELRISEETLTVQLGRVSLAFDPRSSKLFELLVRVARRPTRTSRTRRSRGRCRG